MNFKFSIILIIVALGLIGLSQSVFTVDEREQAIVLQLGQPVGEINGPGLHFKIPVVQEVRRFDSRILSVDPPPEQMVISSSVDSPLVTGQDGVVVDEPKAGSRDTVSGEPIIVDTFTRYRITDPLMFMKTLRTVYAANQRIENIMNDVTRSILGRTTLRQLLSEDRAKIMTEIRDRVNQKTKEDKLGIEIIDTRIVRADLTPELRQSTVRRMISELKERATETRAKGEERALEIRSTAEKERTVIMAEAQRDSQILRGDGDEIAIKTYAEAFNKDKEFYNFVRSMEAYRNTLANPDTRLILSPDSAFFKYFQGE
ncbi:MAG: protease modulator HflC [Rhodospirillales bacterium]|nr:protease modulator HflC [Rhodospirillales bacterium]MCB9996338.1 protease modulator HflC [Rhodospirillales bacterium]